jgi:hypothetical protein
MSDIVFAMIFTSLGASFGFVLASIMLMARERDKEVR